MGSRNGDFVVKRLQFFKKTYSRMAFISEFTNEIYDQSTAAFHEEQDSTRVFLGILVTLLPKIIPRIMPAIMGGDARIQEKFQDAEYITQVEQMFREKFLENLGVFENLIVAWQDNSLAPEDLGLHDLDPNHILAREDLIADSVCCKYIEVMVHDELVHTIGQNAGTYRINDQVNNYTSWVSDNGMRQFGTSTNGTNGLLVIFKTLDQKSEALGQKQMQSALVSVEKSKKPNGIIRMSQFGILAEVKFRLNV